MKNLSVLLLVLSFTAVLFTLMGCENQKIQTATNMEVKREAPAKGEPKRLSQKLVVDLISGKATFTDTDGATLEHFIEAGQLEEIQKAIASNTWHMRELDRTDYDTGRVLYTLVVFEGPKNSNASQWVLPSRENIPDSLKLLMNSMDQSMRRLRPISDNVNLLE
jgi:hypothetical protein